MDKYETIPGVLNIAETCAASISLNDLESLCEDPNIEAPLTGLSSRKLTYGPIRGSDALRERLASLYCTLFFSDRFMSKHSLRMLDDYQMHLHLRLCLLFCNPFASPLHGIAQKF